MRDWLREGLSKLLDFEVPDDMIRYILNTETETELHENMRTLLDFENPQHKNFYNEIVKRKYPHKVTSKQQKKKIAKSKVQQDPVSVAVEPPPLETADKSKKKSKFVNLYSQEGEKAQVVFLKGRHLCNCESRKHGLINNCLSCGRIVCKQEGSGPCMFCGALVCTDEEEKQINSNTKGGAKLLDALMRTRGAGWEQAVALRDRLIEYDQNSEQRTRVIDDDSDYFQLDSVWLTNKEREQLQRYKQEVHAKKHASKLSRKVTFDFAGRQIVEEKIDSRVDEEKIREILNARRSGGATSTPQEWAIGGDSAVTSFDVAPGFNASLLKYDESVGEHSYADVAKEVKSEMSRIQDGDLQLMGDPGRCLSMHQPWASLLVEGIKRHEGRTWYTSHRGRLWIASTAKPPDQDLIKAIEDQYRALYPDKSIKFPTFYPPGCLLGCVTIDDCLPQEEYQKLYAGSEESESPYVWICSNPVSLKLRFPIKGQHKIYNLDKTIHHAALKYIHNVAKMPSVNHDNSKPNKLPN